MPKTPIDYSKSIIYKIQHIKDESLLYVGSTTDFTKRKYSHKTSCNNENNKNYNIKVYVIIRENGGWKSFEMKIIKEFPCQSSIQLKIEEEHCRVEMNANLNINKAYTTKEQSKEQSKEQRKKYYEIHKEQIKKYYEENKDYYKENKEYQKKYYELKKEYQKKYYELKKEYENFTEKNPKVEKVEIIKKPIGRPRVEKVENIKKPRGRPRCIPRVEKIEIIKKPRGRPRVVKVEKIEVIKRSRGRPHKIIN